VTGSGVTAYFFTDNRSLNPRDGILKDNNTGWQSAGSSYSVTLTDTTMGSKTIYAYARDAAGLISDNFTDTIIFDNASPVIDNLTYAGHTNYYGSPHRLQIASGQKSGNITLSISARDNGTSATDNFSSGMKDFYIAYEVRQAGGTLISSPFSATNDNITSARTGWIAITSLSDNVTTGTSGFAGSIDNATKFDNATFVLNWSTTDFTRISPSGSEDNLTAVVWFRDNASNISGNATTIFSFDNSSIYTINTSDTTGVGIEN
jgi:hypothetical protein